MAAVPWDLRDAAPDESVIDRRGTAAIVGRSGHSLGLCMDIGIDMGKGVCIDMAIDMAIAVCVDMGIDV